MISKFRSSFELGGRLRSSDSKAYVAVIYEAWEVGFKIMVRLWI